MYADEWSFHHPGKIFSGRNCIENFLRLHAHDGGQTLIITTRGAIKRGYIKKIQDHIQKDNVCVWDQVKPNPGLDDLDRTTNELRNFKISSIIALGGGSVLDTAKTLSLTLPCVKDNLLHRHFRHKEKLQLDKKISLTAIPTTSGSGAEVTPFATIWDLTACKKYSLNHPLLYPEYVLLKPEFCVSLPRMQTLYSGLDLISHALDSLWNINSNSITQSFAFQALNLANKSFVTVLDNPDDIAGRNDMQHASLLAGLAISQTKTAIAHSISYPLTSHYKIPHGLACSFTLPALLQRNRVFLNKIQSSELFEKTAAMLNTIDMAGHVKKYADEDSIIILVEKMLSSERAGNYLMKIDSNYILGILKQSFDRIQ
ncbi:phosphonoacetaldehyde reductase [Desulfonatronum thioautotrophicum]|uniref:phosphonoacetaldehyde reductase n=1 Tax=Desulfonatronum thioautotrophicum TaxID=617001 RepID=UPI0005EB8935|nr:phosphonoacetaldehyde reductase [Desulfonatronum thioautotrophicum]